MSSKVIKANNVQLIATAAPDLPAMGQPEGGGRINVVRRSAAVLSDRQGPEKGGEKSDRSLKQAYDQGFAAGSAWHKEQSLTTLKAFSQLAGEVGDLKKKLLADAEEQMLRLVVAVAEKVMYTEVATNSQVILGVLREAIKGVVEREGMKIRLNPLDYVFIMDMKADFIREFDRLKNVSFEEDESIQRGGALLETLGGEVDARLEQRLMEVKGALKTR